MKSNFNDKLAHACTVVGATGFAGMIAISLVQIVARYIFFAPPAWTEQAALLLMIWAGLLGASVSYWRGGDPIFFSPDTVRSRRIRVISRIVRSLVVLIFVVPILLFCIVDHNFRLEGGFIARAGDRMNDELNTSYAWIYLAVPVSFFLIMVHAVAKMVLAEPEYAEDSEIEPDERKNGESQKR